MKDDNNSHITAILQWNINIAATFHKPLYQLYKYSCNIAIFHRNILEIFPKYYGAMWVTRNFQLNATGAPSATVDGQDAVN